MSEFKSLMKSLESKWQQYWAEAKIFEAEIDPSRPKFFIIWAYPGISGYLHVGHMRGYTYTDVIARYKRLQGYNVLFPTGVHASGLPAISLALRVKNKDPKTLAYLRQNCCPPEIIPKLGDPVEAVEFFSKLYRDAWVKFGFTVDNRYFINTISSEYQQFIKWQFSKLKQRNLLIQKPHYAPWCPVDGPVAVDPSETDISQGGDAEQIEFILIKFQMDYLGEEVFVIAATLRPETVYGVTNMWVHPDETYAIIQFGTEKWIVSLACAQSPKLGENLTVLETIKAEELIGSYIRNLATNQDIPILPGKFVDVSLATGLVMSVPAHAPFDWIALEDLKKANLEVFKHFLPIEPISLIDSRLGAFSAAEMCKKYHIHSQDDIEALKKATDEAYRTEYYEGIIKVGRFAGLAVSKAKELITKKLTEEEIFSPHKLYEFSKEVICRCGNKISIRMIPDQWFIRYSDLNLKEMSKKHSEIMDISPKQYKARIKQVVDWYDNRACARQGKWLGTPFPFSEDWIIEPISDSTLYPIFFLIGKFVNSGAIRTAQLTEAFFDYVFLGEDSPNHSRNKKLEIAPDLLQRIKATVNYWYPLDINLGGKEHQTVHFPVFLMNHVAILKQPYWPKGIFVNYWITQKNDDTTSEQAKMSKSKGGAEPVQDYIVDALRLYYIHVKSAHQDVEWDNQIVVSYESHLSKVYSLCQNLLSLNDSTGSSTIVHIDKFLLSVTNRCIAAVTDFLEESYNLRKAAHEIYFSMYENLRRYLNRGGKNAVIIRNILQSWLILMTPFTPHIAEELWYCLGERSFISTTNWPKANTNEVFPTIEAEESYINNVFQDIRQIFRLLNINSRDQKTIFIYTAEDWKWQLFHLISENLTKNWKEIIQEIKNQPDLVLRHKNVYTIGLKIYKSLIKDRNLLNLAQLIGNTENELILREQSYLEKSLGCPVIVNQDNGQVKLKKGKLSLPLKPAFMIE